MMKLILRDIGRKVHSLVAWSIDSLVFAKTLTLAHLVYAYFFPLAPTIHCLSDPIWRPKHSILWFVHASIRKHTKNHVVILGTDQKERGLWGRRMSRSKFFYIEFLFYNSNFLNDRYIPLQTLIFTLCYVTKINTHGSQGVWDTNANAKPPGKASLPTTTCGLLWREKETWRTKTTVQANSSLYFGLYKE